ncbi:MAG: Ig-like domain-containing protein [Lachnospiraceae bacterium]|nr:Ig-like domain-containing protein [Lachnospiraceae bacterium]
MNRKKILAPLLAGVITLGLISPPPAAAISNKVVEIPVNFTNTPWEEENWDASRSELNLWGQEEPDTYSDSYTVSFKLYVPVSMMKEESAIGLDSNVNFNDASDTSKENLPWAGYADCPHADFLQDGRVTRWDEETQSDQEVDYASAKKSNDYWVISYKANSGSLHTEDAEADASKASAVTISFNLNIRGINITAKNQAVYLDDLKITKADQTIVYDQNFDSLDSLKDMGDIRVNPNLGENDAKEAKLTTLQTAKTLTVSKTKLTVKAGKKVTIRATAKPATKITYTSSNRKIATVNSKGTVTGKKAGTATITVKANGKTVKVKVTVKK